jgi:hypothetical protein
MVSPIVFMIYGSRIRSWSRFSVGDHQNDWVGFRDTVKERTSGLDA